METAIRFRLGIDGAQQVQQGAAQAAQGLTQLGTAATQAQRATSLTGQQAAQVSAQLQDLFVQIQAGGNPLTALIQQGSQLSAVFGGVGNAVRSVLGAITPAVAALGTLATGVGVLALAYKQASDEADAYTKAIVTTGNAAGVTAGQLGQMARAVSAQVGTQGKAAESLTQLVASGRVASAQLTELAEASIRFERVGGDAAENTNKKFAELGRTPLQALAKLNEAENFLTATLYSQVKALEDQGRTAEAAAAAQQGYAAVVIERSAQIEQRLGTLQKGWQVVGDKAKGAWDAMMGVGRAETIENTIAETEKRIATIQKTIALDASYGRQPSKRDSRDLAEAQALLATQQEGAKLDRQRGERQAAEVIRGQNLVEAGKLMEGTLSNQLKLEKQIAQTRQTMELAGKSPEEIERTINYIKATSAAGQEAFAVLASKINSSVAQAAGQLQAAQIELESQMQRGLVSQRQYIEQSAELEKQALVDQVRALDQLRARTAAQPNSGAAVAQIDAQLVEKTIALRNRELKLRNDLIPVILKENAAVVSSAEAFRKEEQAADPRIIEQMRQARVGLVQQLQAQSAALDDAAEYQQAELDLLFATDAQRAITLEQLRIEIERRREIQRLQAAGASQDEIDLANENAARKKAAAVGKIYADELKRYSQQISEGLTDALLSAIDAGRDGVRSFARDMERMFEQMVLRPTIQAYLQPLVGNVLQALGVGGASGAAGGAGSNWLNLVGTAGQMGGGWGNIANTIGGWFGMGSSGAVSSAAVYNSMAAYEGITASQTAAAATSGGASAASAAIPIIGWIIAAYMASSAAYKGGATHDMIEGRARYSTPGGIIAGRTYNDFRNFGMSEKWATILSGEALVARLLGHKASVSGFGVGSVIDGDFVAGTQAPIAFGRNILGGGADEGLQELAARIAGGVTVSSSLFGGGLKQGLRVGALTDRDRENEVAALLGFFSADNKLIAGTQTGSGAFGAGGPAGAASKIASDELEGWIKEQMPVLIIQGLQQSDLDKRFADYFKSVNAGKLDPELAEQMLQTATAVARLTEAFDPLGGALGQFSELSVEAFQKLATASGGFDQLGQNLQGYYQAFYTEAERTNAAWDGITATLKSVGVDAVPTTREGFRALVDSLKDLGSTADQQTFAALMKVAGAFDALIDASDRAAEEVLKERLSLEGQLLQLQGNTTELRKRERDQLDATNRALYDRITALQDEKLIAEERKSLELQLLQLQGNTVEIRNRERAALDESNRALYDQIQALSDQKAAAARAQQETAAVWSQLAQTLVQGVASAYQQVQQQVDAASQQVKSESEERSRKVRSEADDAIRELDGKAKDAERTFKSLIDSLDDNVRKLRGDIAGDGGRGQALQDLRAARAALQSGGQVDFDRVRDAANTAANIDPSRFASRLDFQREQTKTLQLLRDVGAVSRQGLTQVTAGIAAQQVALETKAEEQIKAIERSRDEQLAALQNQLREAQGIAGTLINIDKGIGSVAEAMAALRTAAQGAAANTNTWVKTGGQEVWASTGGAVATRPQTGTPQTGDNTMITGRSGTFSVADAQAFVRDRLAKGDLIGIYARAVAEGIDSRSLDALMGWAPGTSLAEALRLGLPAFASGTASVPSTGLAVVHEGERIIPAADNRMLMQMMSESGGSGRDELVAEMRSTRAVLEAFMDQQMNNDAVLAANTGGTKRLLDGVVRGGASIATRVAA